MSGQELDELRCKISTMRAEIAELRRAVKEESTRMTPIIKSGYRYIADIHDYLMPVVHKIFPGYVAARKQVDEFMERYPKPSDPKKSN
jgi:hypothetical protein